MPNFVKRFKDGWKARGFRKRSDREIARSAGLVNLVLNSEINQHREQALKERLYSTHKLLLEEAINSSFLNANAKNEQITVLVDALAHLRLAQLKANQRFSRELSQDTRGRGEVERVEFLEHCLRRAGLS